MGRASSVELFSERSSGRARKNSKVEKDHPEHTSSIKRQEEREGKRWRKGRWPKGGGKVVYSREVCLRLSFRPGREEEKGKA